MVEQNCGEGSGPFGIPDQGPEPESLALDDERIGPTNCLACDGTNGDRRQDEAGD
jgi:hypothetical protein